MAGMQRGKQVPWAGIIFGIILLNIFTDIDLPIVPIIIAAVVISMVTGSRRTRSVGRSGGGQPPPQPNASAQPQDDDQLPRIDVPRFPGDTPPPPLPSQRQESGSEQAPSPYASPPSPAPPEWGRSRPQPTPGPVTGATAGGTAYPSSTSTDPVVSLGQLNLSRLARELDTAARGGASGDVTRLLGEVDDVVQRSQSMLEGAAGSPGSGRREFEAGLRRLEREVDAARREQPPGSRVGRVVRTCTSMGQTGRYE